MNLAVIGSGGREHAICYKLKQSQKIKKLICIPGNAGTQKIAENIKEDVLNFEAIYQIIKNEKIEEIDTNKLVRISEFLDPKKFPKNPEITNFCNSSVRDLGNNRQREYCIPEVMIETANNSMVSNKA